MSDDLKKLSLAARQSQKAYEAISLHLWASVSMVKVNRVHDCTVGKRLNEFVVCAKITAAQFRFAKLHLNKAQDFWNRRLPQFSSHFTSFQREKVSTGKTEQAVPFFEATRSTPNRRHLGHCISKGSQTV